MKAAFTVWENRIAPVFDVARSAHIVEIEAGQVVRECAEGLPDSMASLKALRLVELGVDTLVCGAISRFIEVMVADYGIQVIPFIAGELREVIQAWLDGNLQKRAFIMPGCEGRGWRRWNEVTGNNKAGRPMNGSQQGGRGQGGGRGMGGGMGQGGGRGSGGGGMGSGGGRGRQGGSQAAGVGGNCTCPKCGHHEAHGRGIPCVQKQCPKCGTLMVRE